MAEIIKPRPFSHLEAISSIDGRFRGRVEGLSEYFSEHATISGRVFVETEYLIAVADTLGIHLTPTDKRRVRAIHQNFSLSDSEEIWATDVQINHDTKAVEYFLQSRLRNQGLGYLVNFLHFGLTSTDIDNTAFALSLKKFCKEVYSPSVREVIDSLADFAGENKGLVMLARTHGQVAVPTTAGKEINNFRHRLAVQLRKFKVIKIGSKLNGAVGNYNALFAAYPNIDWVGFSEKFLKNLGLESYNPTTQVEPYEHKVELLQAVKRINLVIKALDEDLWRYLAMGYLSLRDNKGHVGSSTMPQKINPIGFEMSESYVSLANGIFNVLEERLPLNRWQRDLTDKYLLRDMGQALAASVLGYRSTLGGLSQIGFNRAIIGRDLENNWEAISEGIQTILRTTKLKDPYEKLKAITRGKKPTKKDFAKFISGLDVPKKIKKRLLNLTPESYVGLAEQLADYKEGD